MKNRKIALAVALIGALCFGSYAIGQQAAQPDLFKLWDGAKTNPELLGQLFDAYAKVPGDAEATKEATNYAFIDSQKGDNSTFQILQAMQNQKLIEQNARIIELLENKKAE